MHMFKGTNAVMRQKTERSQKREGEEFCATLACSSLQQSQSKRECEIENTEITKERGGRNFVHIFWQSLPETEQE